ncbi:MAG TPA: hypothetical protein VNM45_14060 [Bacillus sp. (in: firmicutes)]|nr:hypothetical protein [Bacillus sp. (in: firmicutes)]
MPNFIFTIHVHDLRTGVIALASCENAVGFSADGIRRHTIGEGELVSGEMVIFMLSGISSGLSKFIVGEAIY